MSQSTAKQVMCLIGGYGRRVREFTVPLLSRILKLKFGIREAQGAGKFSFASRNVNANIYAEIVPVHILLRPLEVCTARSIEQVPEVRST